MLEDFWGKGYGRKMMEFALKTLKDMGYSEVLIWAFEGNHRARRFYEKSGFLLDGTTKTIGKYGKPLAAVRYMIKV